MTETKPENVTENVVEKLPETMPEEPPKKKIISDRVSAMVKLGIVLALFMLMFYQVIFDVVPGRTFIKETDAEGGVTNLGHEGVNDFGDFSRSLFLLGGEWEYYPGRLLYPEDFAETSRFSNLPGQSLRSRGGRYVSVPHYWLDDPVGMPGGTGVATYRMIITSPVEMETIGVYSGFQYGAYRLFLNGLFVGGAGEISENIDEHYPSYNGGMGIISEPAEDYVEIIMQIQSYDHVSAGLNDNILFGSAYLLKNYHLFLMAITGIIAGAVLILMLYFLLLFIVNTKRKEYFNFAVVTLCCFYITLSYCGENLIYYLTPMVSPFLLYRLDYIALILGAYFSSIHIIKKHIGFKHIGKIAAAYTAANCLIVVFAEPYRLSSMSTLFYALIVLFIFSAFAVSFINSFFVKKDKKKDNKNSSAVKNTQPRSAVTLEFLSLVVLFGGSAVSQFGFSIWGDFYMLPVFVLIYCFMQLFVLTEHYKSVEKDLYKLNKNLENHVTERTASLVEMSRRLQTSNNAKTEFLTYMSREICTPMNDIVGMSGLFDSGSLNDTQKGYFNGIKNTSQALLSSINDIMDYSKLEAGEMEPAPAHFFLYPFFENICSGARISAKSKKLSFESGIVEDLPTVAYGDEVRIKQIIDNIIAYAIKSTTEGGVKLEVSAKQAIDENPYNPDDLGNSENSKFTLYITITDTSQGIKAEALPNIFSAFINPHTPNSGAGLGLALCKRLVALLKGNVEVESEYEKGSVFKVELPLEKGDAALVRSFNINERIYAKNAEILLVEDDPMNVTVAFGFFAAHDITPDVACDGYKALTMIREKDYDIVFMDRLLPGIDGLETTSRIREMGGKYAALPVVAMTADVSPGAKDMLLFKGMNDYIAKPVDRAILNGILVKWLPHDKITSALGRFEHFDAEEKSDILAGLPLDIVKITDLNCAAVLESMGGNIKLYTNLLLELTEKTADYVQSLTAQLSSENLQNYVIIINGVKNLLYSVGAKACGDSAALLEKAAAENEREVCLDKNGAFCENLRWLSQRISFALAPYREKLAAEAAQAENGMENSENSKADVKKGTPRILEAILREFAFSLSIGDCDNIDKYAAVLGEYTFGEYDPQVVAMVKNAEIMEYDGAMLICDALLTLI